MLRDDSESLGTRSLPGCGQSWSSPSVCSTIAEQQNTVYGLVSSHEMIPVSLSEVSFFNEDEDDEDRAFQCTLAIIKPEIANLMYKVECIMAQNGFIIKEVGDALFSHRQR